MFDELDGQSQKLIDKYKETNLYVINRLKRQMDKGLSEQQQREVLQAIQDRLKELDEAAYQWSQEVLPEYYYITARKVDKDVSQLALVVDDVQPINGFQYVLHQNAVETAIRDTFNDLARRTQYMSLEAKKIIRNAAQDIIVRQLITGESRKETIPELQKKLINEGVTSFVDRSNRKWDIGRYAEMLIKTKTRILANEGTINRLMEYQQNYPQNNNFGLTQISSHNSKDWCRLFEGKVFSLNENHPKYPHISTLPNYPYKSMHPNCRHVWLPYIPALRGEGAVAETQYLNKSISELNKWDYHERKAQR